jgi:hypothetical protein
MRGFEINIATRGFELDIATKGSKVDVVARGSKSNITMGGDKSNISTSTILTFVARGRINLNLKFFIIIKGSMAKTWK